MQKELYEAPLVQVINMEVQLPVLVESGGFGVPGDVPDKGTW